MTKRKSLQIVLGVLALVAAGVAATLAINSSDDLASESEADANQAAAAEDDPGLEPLTGSADDDSSGSDTAENETAGDDTAGSDTTENGTAGSNDDTVEAAPEEFDEPEPESGEPEVLAPIGDQSSWQPVLRCVNGLVIQSDGIDWSIEELGMTPQPLENGEIPRRALVELCGADPTEDDIQAQAATVESLAYELTLLGPISFDPGTTDLAGDSAAVLDIVADLLRDQPGALIEVAGHADSRGNELDNMILSEDRAAAIVTQLEQRGVQNELVPIGRGEEVLRQTNEDDAEALSQNRRIELRVIL